MQYYHSRGLKFGIQVAETKTTRTLQFCNAQGEITSINDKIVVSKATGTEYGTGGRSNPVRWVPLTFEEMAEQVARIEASEAFRKKQAEDRRAAQNADMDKARAVIEPAVAQAVLVNEFLGLYITEAESPRYGKTVIAFRKSASEYASFDPDKNTFGNHERVEVTLWHREHSVTSEYKGHTYSPEVTDDVVTGISRVWSSWMQ